MLRDVIRNKTWHLVLGMVLGALPLLAVSGEFSISPVRLELGGTARSGALVVRNDDQSPLSFRIRGASWTQDPQGVDTYADSPDLIYFPKLVVVEPGKEAVIRVGLRQPLVPVEKTYRLFIEELPLAKTTGAAATGSEVRVLIHFGVPVFVVPVKPVDGLEFGSVEVSKSSARLSLKNTGNQHQTVQGIQFLGSDSKGVQTFATTVTDRYLLSGTTKTYTVKIPEDQCLRLASFGFDVQTNKSELRRSIDLTPSMCR